MEYKQVLEFLHKIRIKGAVINLGINLYDNIEKDHKIINIQNN